ncbi:MAG: peptidoglycan DD-metalloendopeptidase family protein [Steroidobacteraceae bacterium]
MRRLVRIIGLIAWISSMVAGCANERAYTAESYTVQPQDTLYSIAWRHDLDYRDLARWNHIGADYRIAVGQVLTLKSGNSRPHRGAARASSRPAGAAAATPRSAATGAPAAAAAATSAGAPASAGAATAAAPGQPCGWMWPTAQASAPRPVPGGGILLLGAVGQPIRAACAGRVVYAGSGIRGYGNLIIIKHGETLLTAYAHTIQLDVHEGQEVAMGEEIAHMGTGAQHIAALYFEIRINGKPVDPLPLLRGVDKVR